MDYSRVADRPHRDHLCRGSSICGAREVVYGVKEVATFSGHAPVTRTMYIWKEKVSPRRDTCGKKDFNLCQLEATSVGSSPQESAASHVTDHDAWVTGPDAVDGCG